MDAEEERLGGRTGLLKGRWRGEASCVCASLCQGCSDQSLCFGWQMGPVVAPPEGWCAAAAAFTYEHTHTHTLIMFSCNFTSFLAGAAAELTD